MTEETQRKLRDGLARLRAEQAEGKAPQPGWVSQAELAKRCGLSETAIRRIEQRGVAKLAHGLTSKGIKPAEARRILSLLIES